MKFLAGLWLCWGEWKAREASVNAEENVKINLPGRKEVLGRREWGKLHWK